MAPDASSGFRRIINGTARRPGTRDDDTVAICNHQLPPPRRIRLITRMTYRHVMQSNRYPGARAVADNMNRNITNNRVRADTSGPSAQRSGVTTQSTTQAQIRRSTATSLPQQTATGLRSGVINQSSNLASRPQPAPTSRRDDISQQGKDVIKRHVTNPKLRALLSGKAPPRESKKPNQPTLVVGPERGGAV